VCVLCVCVRARFNFSEERDQFFFFERIFLVSEVSTSQKRREENI